MPSDYREISLALARQEADAAGMYSVTVHVCVYARNAEDAAERVDATLYNVDDLAFWRDKECATKIHGSMPIR